MTISSLGILSAAGPIINATITIPQRLFEIKAVSQQARDLLETSNQISQTLEYARTLRDQKAPLLSATEKRWIDDVLGNAERAVKSFALLIEPARVDMQTSPENSLSLATRTLFVLRDSPKVAINLSRLSIAVQHLNTAVGTLSSRNGAVANGSGGAVGGGGGGGSNNNNSTAALHVSTPAFPPDVKAAPPTYEESQFLNWRRSTASTRLSSVVDLGRDETAERLESEPFATLQPSPPPLPTSLLARDGADLDGLQVDPNAVGAADGAPPDHGVEAGLHAIVDWEPFMVRQQRPRQTIKTSVSAEALGSGVWRREDTTAGGLAGRRRGQAWLAYQAEMDGN